ncbi:MAG: CPBP family intramembrane glutamic endopeptidase [Thermoprotei archaeon]
MWPKRSVVYILFVDILVNTVNFSLIKLHIAGSVTLTLVLAPILYVILLGMGYTLIGKNVLGEYKRNARDSLTIAWGYFGIALFSSIVLGIVILGFIVGVEGLNSLTRIEYPSTPLQAQSLSQTLALVALSLLIVGPAEETIFRGMVYGSMLDSSGWTNWRRLNVIQALAFGFAHLYYLYILGPLGLVALVEIIGMGYGLGWAYYKCGGGLSGPIIVHGFWDASSFLLLYPTTILLGAYLKLGFFILVIYSIVKIAKNNSALRARHGYDNFYKQI